MKIMVVGFNPPSQALDALKQLENNAANTNYDQLSTSEQVLRELSVDSLGVDNSEILTHVDELAKSVQLEKNVLEAAVGSAP